MIKQFARVLCFLCLATFAGASHAGEGSVHTPAPLNDASMPSSAYTVVVREPRNGDEVWPETAQMVLFGAGLSYVGLRLGKRKTKAALVSD